MSVNTFNCFARAGYLNARNIGSIVSFDYENETQRGEIRQIHHSGTHTYLFLIDAEYDSSHNYEFPEFELAHDDLILLECEHD